MAKRGRPTKYTPELAEEICERLADGASLRSICRDDRMPDASAVVRWALDPEHPFSQQYARAREAQGYAIAERILDLCEAVQGESGIDAQRAKVAIDGYKWAAGRMAPKAYGDKQQHEVKSEVTYFKAVPADDVKGAI